MVLVTTERLPRFLSFLLRHRPADYPLNFNKQGFVSWDELIEIVQRRFPGVTEQEVRSMVEESEKKRFELKEGKARATYGHSFAVDLGLQSVEPPASLYHGTARDLAQTILRDGLKPRGRQYVHLSPSVDDAIAVGKRRDPSPAVLMIRSQDAHASGIPFYRAGPLFLAKEIPPKFLSLVEN